MSVTTTTQSLAEVRQHLSRYVDAAVATHARVDITRNGQRAAVLLAAEDFDALVETVEILSDPAAMAAIAEGERDLAEGRVYPLDEVELPG